MFLKIKDFLAPTRGRILLFMIIFILVFVYDTAFAPFPGSPVVENLTQQQGMISFVVYILVLPYILSCFIPAFFGMRKKKFIRLVNLKRYFYTRPQVHEQKPTTQEHFVFPQGTPSVENKLEQQPAPVKKAEKPAPIKKAEKPAKAKPKKA
jgi:hypothetical protein